MSPKTNTPLRSAGSAGNPAGSRKAKQKFSHQELMGYWEAGHGKRFMSLVRKNKRTKCWIRTAGKNSKGYGCFCINKIQMLSHRLSYRVRFGDIPLRLEIHHKCENPACCNPRHLTPVTHKENLALGKTTVTSINKSKTHCPKGHALIPENLIKSKVFRECRICNLERARKRYEIKRNDPDWVRHNLELCRKRYHKNKQQKTKQPCV